MKLLRPQTQQYTRQEPGWAIGQLDWYKPDLLLGYAAIEGLFPFH